MSASASACILIALRRYEERLVALKREGVIQGSMHPGGFGVEIAAAARRLAGATTA